MTLGSDDLSRLIALEQSIDRAEFAARRREAVRSAGVSWSGFAPHPLAPRTSDALASDARAKLARLQTWRTSAAGRLLEAVAETQRAAAAAHAAGERARSALSRNPTTPLTTCQADAADMAASALAACRAARRARRLLRAAPDAEAS